MTGFFNRLFSTGGQRYSGGGTRKGEDVFPQVTDDQPRNPYTEVTVLSGHMATVHHIEIIDHKRFISASYDGTTIVWNTQTGQKLHTLRGGIEAVTCVLSLQSHCDTSELCIITAYSDNIMKFWSLNDDDPLQEALDGKIITEHNGLVKCLLQMGNDIVCSGGKDICLWDRNGKLLTRYERSGLAEDESDVHSLLKLDGKHFGVVAASDYKSLAVFDINKLAMTETDQYSLVFVRYLMNTHKENITFLTTVSQTFFASGSRDGVILLWSTNSLSAMKIINCVEPCLTSSLRESQYPSMQIRHIMAIGERYIFVAIGNGFKVYDVLTYEDSEGQPKPLASHSRAHQQPITCMDFIEDRGILVTASEDSTVRLWGNPTRISRDSDISSPLNESQAQSSKVHIEDFLGIELQPSRPRRRGGVSLPVRPTLLGELLLHSSNVKVVKNLVEHGLVTCGVDSMIIIWKVAQTPGVS
ncbi:WD repeat-containing protein 41-like isoform X2 [Halichondria panicea]|uniref:WD repeat-containing protein 41-like isoform X2 n=1 Tax=Halichondria panicea TaxID=6063 RepID=UPI00312B3AFD